MAIREFREYTFPQLNEDQLELLKAIESSEEKIPRSQVDINHIWRKVKKLSSTEILKIAMLFPPDQQAHLRKMGTPTELVTLQTLDTIRMVDRLNYFKSTSIQWVSWGRNPRKHDEKIYNCASIVLDVLYAGGLGKLITSPSDSAGVIGTLLGAGYAFLNNHPWLKTLEAIGVGMLLGRGTGSAYEGSSGIQTLLNLMNTRRKDTCCLVLGLRVMSACLSSVIGTFKLGYLITDFLALPPDVMHLSLEYQRTENAMFTFRTHETIQSNSGPGVLR